ncbi:hypothetical protein TNCV_1010561 [Trichonephila clavipes]|nr:hypothetical protein TNCV_1010561 [Trichonephila clavipes]
MSYVELPSYILIRHHTPDATVDELWHRVEAAWSSVPVHAIQSLFDSMASRISAVTTPSDGSSGYRFLRMCALKFKHFS